MRVHRIDSRPAAFVIRAYASPSKVILDAHDIILAKVVARLSLDKNQILRIGWILDPMGIFAADIDGISRIY